MKNKSLFIGSISALAGILLVILVLINYFLVQDSFLKYTNHKYSVHDELLMDSSELDKVVEQMVAYVKGQVNNPQVIVDINGRQMEFFNQKELGHLKDVLELISDVYAWMICLVVIFIIGEVILVKKKKYSSIINGVFIAWGIIVMLTMCVAIYAFIDINMVIDGFHMLFLGDSEWVLNPSLDRSVWMFMTDMYKDVVVAIGTIVVGTALVSMGIALVLQKKMK